jgi:hypothetical protein
MSGPAVQESLEALQSGKMSLETLTASGLSELTDVSIRLSSVQDDPVLKAALQQYGQLKQINRDSPLRFLGYVAIIESLITHSPEPKDPYDSLTRQVRQKMLLLGRRFALKLPYAECFPGADPNTVWTKLYAYRSCIAHGVKPDFHKSLNVLRNGECALRFTQAATKALMRHVLDEPQLVADLRKC